MADLLAFPGATPAQKRNVNVDRALLLYRTHLQAAGRRPATIALRLGHIERLRRWHPNILAATTADLEEALAVGVARGLKPETLKSMRSSAQSFYSWALRAGLTQSNPALDLEPIHIPSTVARSCPDRAVVAALRNATSYERAMILLGRYAGLRLSQ